jgi:hypothetical protein
VDTGDVSNSPVPLRNGAQGERDYQDDYGQRQAEQRVFNCDYLIHFVVLLFSRCWRWSPVLPSRGLGSESDSLLNYQRPVAAVAAVRLASNSKALSVVEDSIDDNSEATKRGSEGPYVCRLNQNFADLGQFKRSKGRGGHLLAPFLDNHIKIPVYATRNTNPQVSSCIKTARNGDFG